jgi:hypothetical protein
MRQPFEKEAFTHGDHQAFVQDLPNAVALERGFMAHDILLGGDEIACAFCAGCGHKTASSAVPVIEVSDEDDQRVRTSVATTEFRTAPASCEDTKRWILIRDVMES